jgi:ABC-type lipoprotein export system ATPase subunit/GNAT superfamily N-acetyltransferase
MNEIIYDDVWLDLKRNALPNQSVVVVSDLAKELIKSFDYQSEGVTQFYPYQIPELPLDFGIGVIVGASGTGKSTLLSEFGELKKYQWDKRAICDHFDNAKEAEEKLFAVGLTSIPTWLKPYQVLSTGEKFRVDLAINLQDNKVIDEYTSVVDRNIAKAASKSLQKYVQTNNLKNIVIATCHKDVIPYLQPDWIIDTDSGMFCIKPKECLRLEPMVAEIYEVRYPIWQFYSKHHYLTANLHKGATCFIAVIDGEPAGFASALRMPHPTVLNAWRGHRIVVLPDYQGLGIGPRLSNWVAELYVKADRRYFSQTAHPRLGNYREASTEWKPTSMNLKMRGNAKRYEEIAERRKNRDVFSKWIPNGNRLMFSHEFIGNKKHDRTENE